MTSTMEMTSVTKMRRLKGVPSKWPWADGAPIDSSAALLEEAVESPSVDLIAGLIMIGLGDLVGGADEDGLAVPVAAPIWDGAGYNLNTLSQEVLGDLIIGHVFPGLCELMADGRVRQLFG